MPSVQVRPEENFLKFSVEIGCFVWFDYLFVSQCYVEYVLSYIGISTFLASVKCMVSFIMFLFNGKLEILYLQAKNIRASHSL